MLYLGLNVVVVVDIVAVTFKTIISQAGMRPPRMRPPALTRKCGKLATQVAIDHSRHLL